MLEKLPPHLKDFNYISQFHWFDFSIVDENLKKSTKKIIDKMVYLPVL